MPLVTQAEYARHRKIHRAAVLRRTRERGGPIPTYGPRKLIDVAEADALWSATMSAQAMANASAGRTLAQARAEALLVDVEQKRLNLERARGALVSRDQATRKAFAYTRLIRDTWLAWPARIGPQLAATFNLDAATVTVTLEQYVRQQLDELSSDRLDF
jgi:hypothetical protein